MSADVRNLLCAVSPEDTEGAVLDRAIPLAGQLHARLHVVSVIDDEREKSVVEVDSHVPAEALERYHQERAERVRSCIDALIAEARAAHPDRVFDNVVSEVVVREGDDAAQLVLDEAHRVSADLIVLGSHQTSSLLGRLFGSVTHEVASMAGIPVLLVPTRP
ncbi:MAG TPA: universal stress protein [Burkholderiales bacterium]|nr:universal stress protein [Betaproteobacteria bacterium]HQR52871.1 universal stress protein [Burkholderiales bacterium]